MSKLVLNNITSGYASTAALNANNDLIEAALENTLSLDGTSPNSMSADLDMNGQSILNVASLQVAGVDISTLPGDATAAAASAALAVAAADTASLAAVDAEGSAAIVADWSYKGNWVNTTPTYYVNNIVYVSSLGDSYICLVEHTPSADFSTDIAKWGLLALHATATGGVGDMLKADNLQFLADYNLARSYMGLAIGTDVQAQDALLQSLAGQTTANGNVQGYSGVDTAFLYTLSDTTTLGTSTTTIPTQNAVKSYVDTSIAAFSAPLPNQAISYTGTGGITAKGARFSTTASIPIDNTIPQITEGANILDVVITPSRIGAEIEIEALLFGWVNTASSVVISMFVAGTANALTTVVPVWSTQWGSVAPIKTRFTATSTSPVTFSVRAGAVGYTLVLNGMIASGVEYTMGGSIHSYIKATEVA